MSAVEMIKTAIARIKAAKEKLRTWLTNAGVTVPDGTKLDGMVDMLDDVTVSSGDDWEITDASYLFYHGAKFDIFDKLIKHVKTPKNMKSMFSYADISGVDISNIDTSGIDTTIANNAGYLFSGSKLNSLENIVFPEFYEKARLDGMFQNCTSLIHGVFNKLKINGSAFMNNIFNGCTNLKDADFSGIECTGSLTGPGDTCFYNCSNVERISFGKNALFYTLSMLQTFYKCSKLKYLDISMVRVSPIVSNFNSEVSQIFYGCTSLEEIIGWRLGVWKTPPCKTLKRLTFYPVDYSIKASVSINNMQFEVSGFIEMAESLPVTSGGYTISIKGNPCVTGTLSDGTVCDVLTDADRSIATAKGWTLVE